jgi:hypothetical protein
MLYQDRLGTHFVLQANTSHTKGVRFVSFRFVSFRCAAFHTQLRFKHSSALYALEAPLREWENAPAPTQPAGATVKTSYNGPYTRWAATTGKTNANPFFSVPFSYCMFVPSLSWYNNRVYI